MFLRTLLSLLIFSAVAVGAVLVGCERNSIQVKDEVDEPSYRRAASLMREGRADEALMAYARVVEARRDAPESHLAMGQIYLDHLKDPVSAIYHFNRFLALKPDTQKSDLVRSLVETARKEFARSLPGQPFGDSFDRLDLLDKLEEVRAENLDLKRQIAALQARLEQQPRTASVPVQTAQSAPTRTPAQTQSNTTTTARTPASTTTATPNDARVPPPTYIVVGGDTLSSISRKVYGTPVRWRDIYEANGDTLRNPNDLRVGQELRIPR